VARKSEVLHPPHLCCVTTLPSITNTTANIGANSWTGILQSQRNGVGRSISYGATRAVFIDFGAKVNSSYYCNIVLEKGLLPGIRAVGLCRDRWTLQQDGAPAHTAQKTMAYPKKEHINFIEPHMCMLPNSPDINRVDYAIWGGLQQRVYHQRQFKMVKELKRAIVTEGQKLSQRFIEYQWMALTYGGGHWAL